MPPTGSSTRAVAASSLRETPSFTARWRQGTSVQRRSMGSPGIPDRLDPVAIRAGEENAGGRIDASGGAL